MNSSGWGIRRLIGSRNFPSRTSSANSRTFEASGRPSTRVTVTVGFSMADHGRVMRCISFTAQLGRTWKCRAVACVYPPLVCGVIRTDL
jgi:hypothetical protein